MKLLFAAAAILVTALVTLSFSQTGPAPAAAGDSAQAGMNAPAPANPCDMNGRPGMPGAQWGPGCRMQGGMCAPGMMGPYRPYRRLMLLPFFFLGCVFILLGIVNILLTILVCIDMSQRGQFNGLWIPILLLFGIPGTGLYALFRIGDNVKAAAKV